MTKQIFKFPIFWSHYKLDNWVYLPRIAGLENDLEEGFVKPIELINWFSKNKQRKIKYEKELRLLKEGKYDQYNGRFEKMFD